MIRVTADTNIYISALNFGGLPRQFFVLALQRQFQLAVSPALLAEMERVLQDRFSWTQAALQNEASRLSQFATLVHPTVTINAVPDDPDDNRVLECAVEASSAYIITGDNHLLRLGGYEGIEILRVADFLKLLPTL